MQRVKAAIDHIEAHLGENLTLDRLADKVGVSRYHLQRLFRSGYGENLKAYIRKRRLTVAAQRLAETEARIIEIALESGFESQEAFTRSFRAQFGCNPGQYRKRPELRTRPGLLKPSRESIEHRTDGLTLSPDIIHLRKGFEVFGIGAGINFEDGAEVNGNWQQLFAALRADAPELLSPRLALCGVAQADHPQIVRGDGHCLAYVSGLERKPPDAVAAALIRVFIPPGHYARFTHSGSLAHIPDTVNYAWGSWLGRSGFSKSDRPDLERLSYGAVSSPRPVMSYWMSVDRSSQ